MTRFQRYMILQYATHFQVDRAKLEYQRFVEYICVMGKEAVRMFLEYYTTMFAEVSAVGSNSGGYSGEKGGDEAEHEDEDAAEDLGETKDKNEDEEKQVFD